jgi:hypothetical protein
MFRMLLQPDDYYELLSKDKEPNNTYGRRRDMTMREDNSGASGRFKEEP